ncbi:MAG: MTAP family purine nucleoside phosphorylase [Candidatus Woesearchaeota archaeon]
MVIGVIGGTGVLNLRLFGDSERHIHLTKYGKVEVYHSGSILFIQRHQYSRPPHMINHRGNILVLKQLGAKNIISLCSTGSLKKAIKPGDIVIPNDYVQLSNIPTFYDNQLNFTTPSLSERLRKKIISAAKKTKVKLHTRGVYLQTTGPRLETRAEVRFFKTFADVVGMTMASEATLANELQIEYAAICSVDNYANGIDSSLTNNKIERAKKKNFENIRSVLEKTLETIK